MKEDKIIVINVIKPETVKRFEEIKETFKICINSGYRAEDYKLLCKLFREFSNK